MNTWHRIPGAKLATVLFFVFLYAPLIALIALSFNANRSATIWTGFSLDWYVKLADNADLIRAVKNSLTVATTAALISVLLALSAAIVIARYRFRGRGAAAAMFNLPLLVPDIVFGIGALLFYLTVGLAPSLVTVILAHTTFCIPFAFLPIFSRCQTMDWQLLDASSDLYASPRRTAYRILLPLLLPGIVAGFLLAFIVSLDDFIISFFVSGPASITIPVYVFGLMRVGVTPEVNAISSLMLLASVTVVAVTYLVNRRGTVGNRR